MNLEAKSSKDTITCSINNRSSNFLKELALSLMNAKKTKKILS